MVVQLLVDSRFELYCCSVLWLALALVYVGDGSVAGEFYQFLHFSVYSVVKYLCAEFVRPVFGLYLC